tara:strand:+ start:346 stop:690 length:345 start_codon:yes stop_codon:yes gene_type:complete
MSKLLKGRLPFVQAPDLVDSRTFNRTVRLLELSLDSFDPDATPQFTSIDRDQNKFTAGSLIWNVSIGRLQLYDGDKWINLTDALPYTVSKLEATGEIGAVQVITNGSIVVSVHG